VLVIHGPAVAKVDNCRSDFPRAPNHLSRIGNEAAKLRFAALASPIHYATFSYKVVLEVNEHEGGRLRVNQFPECFANRFPSNHSHSGCGANGTKSRVIAVVGLVRGKGENPQLFTTSVVAPCRILAGASGREITEFSEWQCVSMKLGATAFSNALMRQVADVCRLKVPPSIVNGPKCFQPLAKCQRLFRESQFRQHSTVLFTLSLQKSFHLLAW